MTSPPGPPGLYPPADARVYKLFISHAWAYGGDFDGVVSLLKADSSFKWVDLSVPVDDRISAFMALLPKSYRSIVRQLDDI